MSAARISFALILGYFVPAIVRQLLNCLHFDQTAQALNYAACYEESLCVASARTDSPRLIPD